MSSYIASGHGFPERVSSGEEGAVEDFLTFLGAGSHKEPLEILKDAGVDLARLINSENYWKNTSRYRFFFLCVWNKNQNIVGILWYLVLMFISVTNTLTGRCFSTTGQNKDVNLIHQE